MTGFLCNVEYLHYVQGEHWLAQKGALSESPCNEKMNYGNGLRAGRSDENS